MHADDIIDFAGEFKEISEAEWEAVRENKVDEWQEIRSDEGLVEAAKQTLRRLEEQCPQTDINGADNVWIVKPSGLSRGRGIGLFANLSDIQAAVKSKDSNFVIQKYIENPLLYEGRKLDIRQWVLVTDWNPMTVYFYEECYIRLSTSQYDMLDLDNKFSHLTNNSINKHAKGFEAEESFLSQDDFAAYLRQQSPGSDLFVGKIQARMKEIVKLTLACVQDTVENRKNSAEIFGYDFCVDQDHNVWLIEVNASPAWDYSSVGPPLPSQ